MKLHDFQLSAMLTAKPKVTYSQLSLRINRSHIAGERNDGQMKSSTKLQTKSYHQLGFPS